MQAMAIKWLIRAALAAACAFAIWYGIDSVAAAFRERKQLRYDVKELAEAKTQLQTDLDKATARANAVAEFAEKELRARDKAARAAADANRRIERELTDAKSKLAQWSAGADPDLARCLDKRVPQWLLDGSGEAPGVKQPGPERSVPAPSAAAR